MDYTKEYNSKLTTAADAIAKIKDGVNVCIGAGASQPSGLLEELANSIANDRLNSINIYYTMALEPLANTLLKKEIASKCNLYSLFLTKYDTDLIKDGINDEKKHINYVTFNFSSLPSVLVDEIGVDTALITVSKMDKSGYFSFGTDNNYVTTVARNCKNLILEVNENMPRVFGDSMIHISEVSTLVENSVAIPQAQRAKATKLQRTIASHVAKLVNNGDTIQLGSGSMAEAICESLSNHKDLGIHTELLSPALADLIKKGVANGSKKNIHNRKALYASAFGDREFYDFINDNPGIESYSCSYISNPCIIGQNDNLVSINSAVQVDLYGNINAEFLGRHEISGTGGHADFVRGSFMSKGGKSVIVMPSTTHEGLPRIVPMVDQVTTSRMDVDYIVTEYGCEQLRGKSTKQRAEAMIRLSHPEHREDLMKYVKETHMI